MRLFGRSARRAPLIASQGVGRRGRAATGRLGGGRVRIDRSECEPVELLIGSLQPNTRYYYQFRSRTPGAASYGNSAEYTFHTARSPGSTFTFTVQADPHLDFGVDTEAYAKSLANALASKTDFHIDLGDTFMSEKHTNRANAAQQYIDQRGYFDLLGAPVHLVIGNHDGESGRYLDGTTSNLAVWSRAMRMKYFPEPLAPDGRGYYAWETNNVLCVALDPFWYSPRVRRGDDNWVFTLGKEQYDWLKRTLETSKAKFKFVFLHHLVGGDSREGRGGSEASHFFEWGGKDIDGKNSFAQKRPGWEAPIHDLLAKRGRVIVFHGHDHFYVRDERGGVIYQEVPQPGHPRGNTRSAGYQNGVMLPSSGILRVRVSPQQAEVEYVKADAAATVAHRYAVSAQ